jgi:ElaB/YqjD/DUF883 family membrane-anchored ribosome-binding protein
MFGYRLVRDADWRELRDEQARTLAALFAAHERILALTGSEATARAEAAGAKTKAELLTVDLNLARHERATYQHKLTGLPALTANIVSGQPRRSEALGAGVDLYDDVGNDVAEVLEREGLLGATDYGPLDLEAESLTAAVKE